MKNEEQRRRHRRAVNTLGRLVFTTLGPLTLSLLLVAYNPEAHADTITVVGTPGVDGGPGTDGGPGGPATAITPPNSDASNTANATGGAGGAAGSAVSAPANTHGGAGGNATATATTTPPVPPVAVEVAKPLPVASAVLIRGRIAAWAAGRCWSGDRTRRSRSHRSAFPRTEGDDRTTVVAGGSKEVVG
jgi:hypothetical protein